MEFNGVSRLVQSNIDDGFMFSIDAEDAPVIMSLLREKIYSNVEAAVIREYACNAADAHRDAGKHDVPIDVQLPTYENPVIVISDQGIGIPHDDVANVFVKYGKSTKSRNNAVTGCFGLGCKSAFAVTETFFVTNRHGGVEKKYCAFIDATGAGMMSEIYSKDTDSTGVVIEIPINKKAYCNYRRQAEVVLSAFSSPVRLDGAPFSPNKNVIIDGDGWEILHKPNPIAGCVVMGNVAYPITSSDVEVDTDVSELVLHAAIGDVDIAANREALSATKKTKDWISSRIEAIKKEIHEKFYSSWTSCVQRRKKTISKFESAINAFPGEPFKGDSWWLNSSRPKIQNKIPFGSAVYTTVGGTVGKRLTMDVDKDATQNTARARRLYGIVGATSYVIIDEKTLSEFIKFSGYVPPVIKSRPRTPSTCTVKKTATVKLYKSDSKEFRASETVPIKPRDRPTFFSTSDNVRLFVSGFNLDCGRAAMVLGVDVARISPNQVKTAERAGWRSCSSIAPNENAGMRLRRACDAAVILASPAFRINRGTSAILDDIYRRLIKHTIVDSEGAPFYWLRNIRHGLPSLFAEDAKTLRETFPLCEFVDFPVYSYAKGKAARAAITDYVKKCEACKAANLQEEQISA